MDQGNFFTIILWLILLYFLISGNFKPSNAVMTPNVDVTKRAKRLGATNPIFSGVSESDDQLKLQAREALPVEESSQRYLGRKIDATIELTSGRLIHISSNYADITMNTFMATMIENVIVTTDTGYRLTNEKLDTRFDTMFAESPGPVAGTGPIGDITSNSMLLTHDDATDDANLLLKGNVKVIYQPRLIED